MSYDLPDGWIYADTMISDRELHSFDDVMDRFNLTEADLAAADADYPDDEE